MKKTIHLDMSVVGGPHDGGKMTFDGEIDTDDIGKTIVIKYGDISLFAEQIDMVNMTAKVLWPGVMTA